MSIRQIDLEEKYKAKTGQVFMSGIQALVRLTMLQSERDRAVGLNTAGYVTGYRGSPLGTVDLTMQKAAHYLKQHTVVFHPGLNEDLAATAIWGTQQVNLFDGARYDGVYALWYGKGPGVDRSTDVLKHGNAAGSSRFGGVLIVAGDDHAAKSSTFPHQSDHTLIAAMIPVLNPCDVQEVIEYGLHGWAMSRYAGCWVAMKAVSDTIESSAIVDISPERTKITLPKDFIMPADGLAIRWPDPPLEQEKRVLHYRLYAALAYARANNLNRLILNPPQARLGIITTGKSYLDVMQALDDLGIDEKLGGDLGLRILKVGMVWPLEAEGVRHFAQGLDEILVVEEKRQIIEYQLKEQLYNWREDVRPRVVGKFAEKGEWDLPHGDWLLPAAGELTPAIIARAIAARLATIFDSPVIHERLAFYEKKEKQLSVPRETLARMPHYCSGCPHNISTRLPEGSRALAGIGCHYMALWVNPNTKTFAQMGGEGVPWIGQAPFTDTQHVFANLGDGTYFHSGILAIRAAVAAGVNITYKLLFNDAVAMTGGQPVDGQLDVPMLTHQLYAEGVRRIVITTDQPEKYIKSQRLAPHVEVYSRVQLDRVQHELRETKGTTVLIHEQICAAEKRRRRKRGSLPELRRRVYINERVCEGCGDCSEKSGCLSILPVETPLGRKRRIDQSSCNKDFSCLEGFCPSFILIEGGELRKNAAASEQLARLPPPPRPLQLDITKPYGIMVTGVGGTGVVTIGQVLGIAAHLDGKGITVLDMAGLAQKGGSVWSHVRIANRQEDIHAVRIAAGDANLILGCDLVVSASEEALSKMREGFSYAVINSEESPTSGFLSNPDLSFPSQAMKASIRESVGQEHFFEVNATYFATSRLGDALMSNMFMLGYAWQKGLVPLSEEAILEAIRLNDSLTSLNQQAFRWGRQVAHQPYLMDEKVHVVQPVEIVPRETPAALIDDKLRGLTSYQGRKLTSRYENLIYRVWDAEKKITPEKTSLTMAVARNYFQVLTYKDEYEVARLYTDGQFMRELNAVFEGKFHLYFNFSAGWLVKGQQRKIKLGKWAYYVMKYLAKLRFLRGTFFDPFRWQADRKLERRIINEFEQLVDFLLVKLDKHNLAAAVSLVNTYQKIRGFGHIKLKNYLRAKEAQTHWLNHF